MITTKNDIMDMAEALVEDKHRSGNTSKIYKAQSDSHKAEMLSADIRSAASMLRAAARQNRVDLSDTEDVMQRVDAFLSACAEASKHPTQVALCSLAFGCSRQNVQQWMKNHPDHDTTQYLLQVSDAFASILVNAGLYGNASAPMAIFELKNAHGYRDQVDIAPIVDDQKDKRLSTEEIKKRYLIDDVEFLEE